MERRQSDSDPQRFGRDHRLRKRPEFLCIYDQGRRVHGRLAVIFGQRRPDDGPWRIGLTATKKTAAAAVVRNRLRRRAREFFRRHGSIPNGWDFVINFKTAACRATAEEFERDLRQILARLAPASEAERGREP